MSAAAWESLHRDPRHRLEWPSEHVVRFLAAREPNLGARAVDIGCGAGRHTRLLERLGYRVSAVDTAGPAGYTRGDMRSLPFASDHFDVAVAFGVFYYGTRDDHRQAVREMHRVLRPGGRAFVCVRTDWDWRQRHTFGGVFRHASEAENGMPMHFLAEREIPQLYHRFTLVEVEKTETTRRGQTRCDSDWLLTCTK